MAADQGQKKQRMCVACGQHATKGALHRIVRNADGSISFDPTGRMPGRGAYVCSEECFAAASKTGKLARALKAKLGHEDQAKIAGDLARALCEAHVCD